MAKLIKDLHDRFDFALKKGLSSYVSPDKIDSEAFAEINNLWLAHIDDLGKTQKINLFFLPFQRIESITGLTGSAPEGSKAAVNCHKYPISIKSAAGKRVTKLTIGEYDDAFNHPNKPPTTDYPICKFVGNVIYVAPNVDVTVTYIATPIKPVYAFTTSGDDYIYDDTNSVDIEFDVVWHDFIVNRVLANLGLNMRELQLIQYSEQQKAEEGK